MSVGYLIALSRLKLSSAAMPFHLHCQNFQRTTMVSASYPLNCHRTTPIRLSPNVHPSSSRHLHNSQGAIEAMDDYICMVQETQYMREHTSDDGHSRRPFVLRNADQLKKTDVGFPLFVYDRRAKIEGLVPTEEDQRLLTKKEQAWLLVEIPLVPDYPKYAWAALRPLREMPWQKYAQERSDGYFAPVGWKPKYPEPSKWYKRRPGSAFEHSQEHPSKKLRLRMLVRLSDALNRAALDHTQDWFFIDLPIFDDAPTTDTVGDLLLFTVELVGNHRLRPGQLVLSAGRPNERLWQRKTPLVVLWNHLHIASLKPSEEIAAFASLNNAEHLSTLGKIADEAPQEGEYFAIAAVHSLPDWVVADESKELRDKFASGPCRLPHEEMPTALLGEELMPPPSATLPTNRKKKNLPPRTGIAAAVSSKSSPSDGRNSKATALAFQ